GFTQFVHDTDIAHSQHIIRELLEVLIDSNELGLQISEIEGDAILFYRFGQAPTVASLLAQIQKMYVNFHLHLKKYETHRICSCGACKGTAQLSLKFIVHYGHILQNQVKNFSKLFGKEVIVAHRLLKNQVEHEEYALFTSSLVNACSTWVELPVAAWSPVEHQSETYDSGKIDYCFIDMNPLARHVPEPEIEDYSLVGKSAHVFESEAVIEAPIEEVFSIVADLPWRTKWIPDTMEQTDHLNHEILQNGATHRCLANGPVVVTHDFSAEPDKITFTETDSKGRYCVVYSLYRLDDKRTRMRADFLMKKHLIMNALFRLFMKKKMLQTYEAAWQALRKYCQQLRLSGRQHPYRIVLEPAA
ncbi:MAG: DUF2652 domain-containing protein, partial [Bacteroidetes bacterium]